jgi:diguanylate cyclase (GGDEF)-like protein
MNPILSAKWLGYLEILDVAFQPILNIHTGKIYAVEALLRNHEDIGFKSIFSLFDAVYKENILYTFDLALREKAFKKYATIKNAQNIKLFYNLDNRLLSMPNFSHGNTSKLLKKLDIPKENICFEISERHEIAAEFDLPKVIEHYKNENISIAIDDFGVGYSGFKLLYDSAPDIIKIDRYLLQNIENNLKKKLMVRSITHLAIQLGIKVVAEGVETKEELLTCREIGCHLVQGYLIQRPTKNTKEIQSIYVHIAQMIKNDKRGHMKASLLSSYVDKIEPISIKTKMDDVINYFKRNRNTPVVPIISQNGDALGILYESQIKDFLYSPFGMSLLLNEENKYKLKHLMNLCGDTDINSSLSTIIELFSNNPESAGIVITKNSQYYGFLSAKAIINIINAENILQARDQNPLTKLPGNTMIEKYIAKASDCSSSYLLCYLDLDNFKAFNDVYGFRNGDRVIQLFADILRKELHKDVFKAHIGGDDFFIAFKNKEDIEMEACLYEIQHLLQRFSSSAKEFYSHEDKENGYIVTKDRNAQVCKFPLLSASASLLGIPKNLNNLSEQLINSILSKQKKVAKNEMHKIAVSCLI